MSKVIDGMMSYNDMSHDESATAFQYTYLQRYMKNNGFVQLFEVDAFNQSRAHDDFYLLMQNN